MKLIPNFDFSKLKNGLTKTRDNIVNKISEVVTRKAVINDETLEELADTLISCDLGFNLTETILNNSRSELFKQSDRSINKIQEIIKEELKKVLRANSEKGNIDVRKSGFPFVILIVGINGSGKTTTVGKLAHNFKSSGNSVIIGSADTFRAAANDQLKIWAQRAGVELIEGSSNDPAAVAYETISKAIKEKYDIVLIDTAGRLHNNKNLMEELKKIRKSVSNLIPSAPDETWLVVDGNSGQNAINQSNEFQKYSDLTGLIVTKLDGTAKGGVVFQICAEKKIPVRYIGIGEGIDDLLTFSADKFVDAIFS